MVVCKMDQFETEIVRIGEGTSLERLASREVRRYVYLRSEKILAIRESFDERSRNSAVVLINAASPESREILDRFQLRELISSLSSQEFCLKTIQEEDRKTVFIIGGDPLGVLYGAYRFAEHLGIRFYLHGDVIPDQRSDLNLPMLDETHRPLFEVRGIQPFHDFPEGPDWWNPDHYKAVLAQMTKMGMNFFGLHTYPEGPVGPEPAVWIGLEEDHDQDGFVRKSYPSRHFTTRNATGSWGYEPAKTSDYYFGAGNFFERDDFSADYMEGTYPWNELDDDRSNDLFNRFGEILNDVFSYARAMGIKTCIGTETPLIVPEKVKRNLDREGLDHSSSESVEALYRGIFSRIMQTHPLDYYWFWTPEDWTWSEVREEQVEKTVEDLRIAIRAAEQVNAPFTLATCGWVLGPPNNRAHFDQILPKEMPMSCINRNVGHDPVEPGFRDLASRPKWAIPWLEDDPAQIIPQLWVGRMRKDAFDARQFGCTGLLGIHWRTRILGPNASALARAAWDQSTWSSGLRAGVEIDFTIDPESRRTQFDPSRHAPQSDFYLDWSLHQFGPEAADRIAEIFTGIDGKLPRPSTWVWGGPGGLKPDLRDWKEVEKEYDFVIELESLEPEIRGPGNRERFDFWLNSFRYLKQVGRLNCIWAKFNKAMETTKKEGSKSVRQVLARENALPLRIELVRAVELANRLLMETVSTTGGMGNMANWQQHIIPNLLHQSGEELAEILEDPLPLEAMPQKNYSGGMRMVLPVVRNTLASGEELKLKVIIVGFDVADAQVYWRPLGKGKFESFPLEHVNRDVYQALFPGSALTDDFEYYIEAKDGGGQVIQFPATAPETNQTVVVFPIG